MPHIHLSDRTVTYEDFLSDLAVRLAEQLLDMKDGDITVEEERNTA